MISTHEYSEYFNLMETYNIKPEAMLMIVKYCVDLKGDNVGYKYVLTVGKDFGNRGINTVEKVEKELSNYLLRTSEIAKILKAMSLKRQPEIEDLNYLNKWTKELGFELEHIVFAGSKIKKSTFKKLDDFLVELYYNKCFSIEEINNFMVKKEYLHELAIKVNKALSVYYEVIDTVVDNYTSKWDSFGYSESALLFIAGVCFKYGENTLEYMDKTILDLYKKGVISMESITYYFAEMSKDNGFIKQILDMLGIKRRPNDWDRENLRLWKGWNFSEEMILEAVKISQGKSSPISYINAILGDWKNKNIFIKDQIPISNYKKATDKNFNNERTYTKEELDKMVDSIYDIDF